MAEVFALHDRTEVELFAYYCGPQADDAFQARFKATVDHWVPISDLSDLAAALRISDDGIHILVDVNGYTRDGRIKRLPWTSADHRQLARLSRNMGSPYHHYIIADDWIIPEDHEIYYSESVLRSPCYQPNDRQRVVSVCQSSRQEVMLPHNEVVYCCSQWHSQDQAFHLLTLAEDFDPTSWFRPVAAVHHRSCP